MSLFRNSTENLLESMGPLVLSALDRMLLLHVIVHANDDINLINRAVPWCCISIFYLWIHCWSAAWKLTLISEEIISIMCLWVSQYQYRNHLVFRIDFLAEVEYCQAVQQFVGLHFPI